jgi:hypothetical protein
MKGLDAFIISLVYRMAPLTRLTRYVRANLVRGCRCEIFSTTNPDMRYMSLDEIMSAQFSILVTDSRCDSSALS